MLRSNNPLFYLVRRGSGPGTLDSGMKTAALECGVELRFGERGEERPREPMIRAHGPRGCDAVAVGYVFGTGMSDGVYGVLSDQIAPKGYAHLLVHRGCGTGQISLTRSARRGGVLLAGEAAGFQDALWGFGIRYALLSGHLAARALLSGADYDRLWKRRFGGLQRASVVNRYFFARMGHPGYRWLMRALRRSPDPRDWLRGFYAPSFWKSLWAPMAARLDGWTR